MNFIKKYLNLDYVYSSWFNSRLPLFVLFVALALVVTGVLSEFLFGDKLLLFTDIGSDTFYSYYAAYYFFTSQISSFQLSFWTFNIGAGSSVLILYQFLYDPFSVIFYFGGAENISRLIVWVFVLKIFCAAMFAYLYFNYLGIGKYASIVSSLLFAFNGFLMCFSQHYFYASWVVFLPLFLYTIEIWIRTNKSLPMVFCVSFLVLNIAIFWQMSVFCFIYILFRSAFEWGKYSKQEWCIRLIRLSGIFALGLGISAVLWLPEYYILKTSPRISMDFLDALVNTASNFLQFNSPDYYRSLLARVFSNNLQGIGSKYIGFLNYYESIQLYVGILPLLLLPQLYSVFSLKAKWTASFAILAIFIFLVFPGFGQVMNGFQYPTYRWGYNIIMFELLLTALVLDLMLKYKKLNLPVLVISGSVLFICALYLNLYNYNHNLVPHKFLIFKTIEIAALIVCYSILLYSLVYGQKKYLTFSFLLLIICGELVLEHQDSFSSTHRSVLNKGIEQDKSVVFFDYGKQAVKKLKISDPTAYRIEKNHWVLSLNDAFIQNYFGLDSYNSINSEAYISFLKKFDYPLRNLNIVNWNSLDYPYLADVLGVKYHLTKNGNVLPHNVTFVENVGDVSIYLRNSYLPFGFTYDSYMLESTFNQLSRYDRERALLQGVVLDSPPLIKLNQILQISPLQADNKFRESRREDVFKITEMGGDRIFGNIRLERPKLLFLPIPFEHGWSAYVNGQKTDINKVNLGFSGLYLEQGDNIVELKYIPPYLEAGAVISILCLFIMFLLISRIKK
jgi:uncharacterized membrane protein YfhO